MSAGEFPIGCTIKNIRRGAPSRYRDRYVYAELVGPDGVVLISATLDYIAGQLAAARIGNIDAPDLEIAE